MPVLKWSPCKRISIRLKSFFCFFFVFFFVLFFASGRVQFYKARIVRERNTILMKFKKKMYIFESLFIVAPIVGVIKQYLVFFLVLKSS